MGGVFVFGSMDVWLAVGGCLVTLVVVYGPIGGVQAGGIVQ